MNGALPTNTVDVPIMMVNRSVACRRARVSIEDLDRLI